MKVFLFYLEALHLFEGSYIRVQSDCDLIDVAALICVFLFVLVVDFFADNGVAANNKDQFPLL